MPLDCSSTGHWPRGFWKIFSPKSIAAAGTGVVPLHEVDEHQWLVGVGHLRKDHGIVGAQQVGRRRGRGVAGAGTAEGGSCAVISAHQDSLTLAALVVEDCSSRRTICRGFCEYGAMM